MTNAVRATSQSDIRRQEIVRRVFFIGTSDSCVLDFSMPVAFSRTEQPLPFPWDRATRVVLKLRDKVAHDAWLRAVLELRRETQAELAENPSYEVPSEPAEPEFVDFEDTNNINLAGGVIEAIGDKPGQIILRPGLITPAPAPGDYDVRLLAYGGAAAPETLLHERRPDVRPIFTFENP